MSDTSTPTEAPEAVPLATKRRWALDDVYTRKLREQVQTERQVHIRRMVDAMGKPIDIARALMQHTPPIEWERELRALSPVSEAHSYLIFAWKEPPLQPELGRWCIYEAVPAALLSTERLLALGGTPYWELPKAEREAAAQQVSAYQWEMYRRHRVDVRPFWCLQGTEGGTPFHHSPIERRYLRMMQKPEWPLPLGALPYAPWDNRVRTAVLERDRLVRLGGDVERLRASGRTAAIDAQTAAQEQEYRRRFWDWFAEKLAPSTELFMWIEQQEDADRLLPRQTREDAIAASEARDVFIETGRVPDPAQYRPKS